jgi:LPS-assembly protein
VLNASYRFSRETIRQIDLSAQWPVAAGWYAVGRYNYSLLDKRVLEGLAGFEYNAGCWVFRAVVQRVQAATQVSSTGFFLQLEFNGIGQVGTDDAVALLSRNVPGYAVTNPRDPALAPPSMRQRLPFEQIF